MCITSRRRKVTIFPPAALAAISTKSAPAFDFRTGNAFERTSTVGPYLVDDNETISNVYGMCESMAPVEDRKPTVVQHDYHDHASDQPDTTWRKSLSLNSNVRNAAKGCTATAFPVKLHEMLDIAERDGFTSVVSWQPHGRSFVVHRPKEFVEYILPRFFKQSKMSSFQRQLNLYGFNRLTAGLDKGGYYHELFLRHRAFLCQQISRMKVKGTGVRLPSSPDTEPNFYAMAPVGSGSAYSSETHRTAMVHKEGHPVKTTSAPLALRHIVHQSGEDRDAAAGKISTESSSTTVETSHPFSTSRNRKTMSDSHFIPIQAVSLSDKSTIQPVPSQGGKRVVSDDEVSDDDRLSLTDKEMDAFFAAFDDPLETLEDAGISLDNDLSLGHLLDKIVE